MKNVSKNVFNFETNLKGSQDSSFFENRVEKEWLSTMEAAQFLSVSENALRIMVYRNQIPVFKFGHRLRFRFSDCKSLFSRKRD